jgi:hypothetical protein
MPWKVIRPVTMYIFKKIYFKELLHYISACRKNIWWHYFKGLVGWLVVHYIFRMRLSLLWGCVSSLSKRLDCRDVGSNNVLLLTAIATAGNRAGESSALLYSVCYIRGRPTSCYITKKEIKFSKLNCHCLTRNLCYTMYWFLIIATTRINNYWM